MLINIHILYIYIYVYTYTYKCSIGRNRMLQNKYFGMKTTLIVSIKKIRDKEIKKSEDKENKIIIESKSNTKQNVYSILVICYFFLSCSGLSM